MCWGQGVHGQLGIGSYAGKQLPTALAALTSGVTQVVAGSYHVCALLSSGGVKCWGDNLDGAIGDGTTTTRTSPTTLSTLTSGVTQLAAGYSHTCALLSTGGVKCWGWNADGQLGLGDSTSRTTPTDLSTLSSGVTQVVAGDSHTCALLSSGGVKCWGYNASGQLGVGDSTSRNTPTALSTLTSGVTQLAARGNTTCARLSTGAVKCWGFNFFGQIGDGTTTSRNTPTSVPTLTSGVSQIETSGAHTCALLSTGGIQCWGFNSSGQLGDGTTSDNATPANVPALTSGVTQIRLGGSHSCALLSSTGVKCWGGNGDGQLGTGNTNNYSTPVDVIG